MYKKIFFLLIELFCSSARALWVEHGNCGKNKSLYQFKLQLAKELLAAGGCNIEEDRKKQCGEHFPKLSKNRRKCRVCYEMCGIFVVDVQIFLPYVLSALHLFMQSRVNTLSKKGIIADSNLKFKKASCLLSIS